MKRSFFFKNSAAVANYGGAMEGDTISKHRRKSKSQTSRGIFKYVIFLAFIVMFSGCSHRLVDFTMISSKNHGLRFDRTKAVKVEGKDIQFLGIGVSIKGAMDKALESAGPGFDLLVDGVVLQQSYFFVAGFKVTGTAVRSDTLISELGEEEYLQWLEENNIFDPNTAVVEK